MMKQFGAPTSTTSGPRPSSSFFAPPSPDPSRSSSSSSGGPSSSSAAAAAGSWATDGVASLLRLSASETNTLASSVETLRDLFWTLYSKMDAVLQGFRVAYEVAGRIAEVRPVVLVLFLLPGHQERRQLIRLCDDDPQRRDFKDATFVKTSSGNLLFSLLDVWKPVQQEVRPPSLSVLLPFLPSLPFFPFLPFLPSPSRPPTSLRPP